MTYRDTQLLINNQWQDARSGKTLDVINPATGQVIGKVSHAETADLDDALRAAQEGFEVWRDMPALERSRIMRDAASLVRSRADDMARLMTQEQGKPLAEARLETLAAADIFEWFAEEGRRVHGRIVPPRNVSTQQWVIKEPVGPVAAFTPWNFPINQIARKLGAALAAGCSCIVKAPEETPASPAALLKAFVDAGIPRGVVGLVYGDPATISDYLIRHPVIRKITFTGSTAVGKQLASLAGAHMKRVTMELGGHAPVIVCEDADVDLAVAASASAKFRNAGQVCIAPTRFLVHESIREQFVDAMVQRANAIEVGDGLSPQTTMGPLANSRRVSAMSSIIDDAVARGADLIAGGKRLFDNGFFFAPTVLNDVPLAASVFNEEPFGPVAAIRGFNDLDEAITEANRLPYGLAAYAFTRDIGKIHRLTRYVEAGMLWINQPATPSAEMPFGGIKDSGYGSEGGPEAVEAFLNTKSASVLTAW